ncbi:Regulatory protein RecX [hydrothermal vent metagenome]|uniref:Regulatory protein RecX n=1 Tax=hydrothermal vent metagenome TaxID=652676 RepID=A0A3B0Z501_9ZZZZ
MQKSTLQTSSTESENPFGEACKKAYACAMGLLARREHSERELGLKLVRRDNDAAVIDAVLAQLVNEGYLSNARFAEVFVRSRHGRGVGPLRIRAELRQRGVDDHLVEEAFRELSADWFDAARRQRDKRFGLVPPQDIQERARQMRFLQQRGFNGEQARAAIDSER